jgi:hypothetical protein
MPIKLMKKINNAAHRKFTRFIITPLVNIQKIELFFAHINLMVEDLFDQVNDYWGLYRPVVRPIRPDGF